MMHGGHLVEEELGGTSSHAQLYQLQDMCNLMWGETDVSLWVGVKREVGGEWVIVR